MKKLILAGLALSVFSLSANAAMVTISGDGSAHATWINSGAGSTGTNYGSDATFRVDGDMGGFAGRGLVKFDGVPLGVTIDSAFLSVMTNDAMAPSAEEGNTDATISAHRIIQNANTMWSEGAVTWDTFGTAGGTSGVDYDATADATIPGPGIVQNTLYTMNVTSLVQEWSNGVANQGVALLGSTTDGVSFYGDEGSFSPQLQITYTAVPEPAAFLMLGLVGLGFGGTRWWKSRKTEK